MKNPAIRVLAVMLAAAVTFTTVNVDVRAAEVVDPEINSQVDGGADTASPESAEEKTTDDTTTESTDDVVVGDETNIVEENPIEEEPLEPETPVDPTEESEELTDEELLDEELLEEELLEDEDLLKEEDEEEVFEVSSSGTLTAFNKPDDFNGEVIIPDGVMNIDVDVFKGNIDIVSVVFPKSLTSLPKEAFKGCSNLQIIEFKSTSTLKVTGDTFSGCALKTIKLSEGITAIPDYFMARAGLGSDATVYIPASVTKIGQSAFDYGSPKSIAHVEFATNSKLTTIGRDAFNGCNNLTSISLPASLVAIVDCAFANCRNLTSVTFEGGEACKLTSIGASAFDGCSELTAITIPKNVINVRNNAFKACGKLSTVNVESVKLTNTGGKIFSGCNISSVSIANGLTTFPCLFEHASFAAGTVVTIPESVKTLAPWAFASSNVAKVEFAGNNLTTIGEKAFEDCTFATITLPDSVQVIGNSAFLNCRSLTDIVFPTSLQKIDRYAFMNCSGLTGLGLPSSLKTIAYGAFQGCTGITDLTIPDSVTTIDEYAFLSCSSLRTLTVSANVTVLSYRAFGKCNRLETVYLGTNLSRVSQGIAYAFEDADSALFYICGGTTSSKTYLALKNAVKNNLLSEDQIIVAKRITYKLNDGVATGNYATSYTPDPEGATTINLLHPTRTWYVFKGWYLDAGFTKPIGELHDNYTEIPVSGLSGNVTLYAKWSGPRKETIAVSTPSIYAVDGDEILNDASIVEGTKLYFVCEDSDAKIEYKINKNGSVVASGKYSSYIEMDETGDFVISAKAKVAGVTSAETSVTVHVLPEDADAAYDASKAGKLWMTYKGAEWDSTAISVPYTGAAVKLSGFEVFYGKTKLVMNTDYTVSYKNNVKEAAYNAVNAKNASIAPTIIIKGKGSINGSLTQTFTIAARKNASAIKLANNNTTVTITSPAEDLVYNGNAITPNFTIVYNKNKEDELEAGIDYIAEYSNNVNAGTGLITITFLTGSDYYGVVTKKFSIAKMDIAAAYDGGMNLVEKKDYTKSISYKNVKNASGVVEKQATEKLVGKGNFKGTKLIVYTVEKIDIVGAQVQNLFAPIYTGAKGLYKPASYKVYYNGALLKERTHYTVAYKMQDENGDYTVNPSSKTVYAAGTPVMMVITGKGDYTGELKVTYNVSGAFDISDPIISVAAGNIVYANKANICKPKITVKNTYTGTTLKAGAKADYVVDSYKYTDDTVVVRKSGKLLTHHLVAAGTVVDMKNDIIPAGTVIEATLKGVNKYSGQVSTRFSYIYDMTKASVKVANQTYTGRAVVPTKSAIVVKVGSTTLSARDYEIVSCTNNLRAGTAKITIKGNGAFKGTKTVNFKIVAKKL
jgi:uncharacterized repeat protein (TIGR02543 family)